MKDGIAVNNQFTLSLTKEIHRFQKKHETNAGRSKADCIIGFRTIQALLAELGVNESIARSIDKKFNGVLVNEKAHYDGWKDASDHL